MSKKNLIDFGFTKSVSQVDDGSDSPSSSKTITGAESDSKEKSESENRSESESQSESVDRQSKKRRKKNVVRKYDPDYLKYGFVPIEKDGVPRPSCLICDDILANSSMLPAKLLRHLETKHPQRKNESIEYFNQLKMERNDQSKDIKAFTRSEFDQIKASFEIAYRIALAKKPLSIGEELLQPCLAKVMEIMFDKYAAAKVEQIPLSRRTVSRRFADMADDVKKQLCDRLKKSESFALQFDESTDISNEAILIGFVRYLSDFKIVEDIFCMCSLPEKTTGEKIFETIDGKIKEYELEWNQVIGVCTDGAAAMKGSRKGLKTRMSAVANDEFISTHCILHLEALASKKMSAELNQTLISAVKMINNIKMSALNSRIFSLICAELESEHDKLLLHADVRWLSRGRTLSRLYELRKELFAHFDKRVKAHEEKKKKSKSKKMHEKIPEETFLAYLKDEKWLITLAYLSDIFASLNELNLQLQGPAMNCFVLWNKVEAFRKRMAIWEEQVQTKNLTAFALTYDFLAENESLVDYIQPIVLDHLRQLILKFDAYFPAGIDPRSHYLWVENPFLNFAEPHSLTEAEHSQLLGKIIFYF